MGCSDTFVGWEGPGSVERGVIGGGCVPGGVLLDALCTGASSRLGEDLLGGVTRASGERLPCELGLPGSSARELAGAS